MKSKGGVTGGMGGINPPLLGTGGQGDKVRQSVIKCVNNPAIFSQFGGDLNPNYQFRGNYYIYFPPKRSKVGGHETKFFALTREFFVPNIKFVAPPLMKRYGRGKEHSNRWP